MDTKHVVSLELARQMKEAGFPQVSEFYWILCDEFDAKIVTKDGPIDELCEDSEFSYDPPSVKYDLLEDEKNGDLSDDIKIYSAYLASELGEILKKIKLKDDKNGIWKDCQIYMAFRKCGGKEENMGQIILQSMRIDLAAKMLLYLAKEGLINPKELKV